MRNCNLISLHYAKVSELPDELECPNLNLFSIHSKKSSMEIPNNFFQGMKSLKVLTFNKMKFSSLPFSICFLKTLVTLCLVDCDVKDIVILGELDNLEVLELSGYKIIVVPDEIGQLKRLKLLDLSKCSDLKVISPGVLSSLSRLEELYLFTYWFGSHVRWEVEGGFENNERRNASLVELQHLSRLTTLELHIPDVKAIPKNNLFFGKLERFKISIGDGKWGSNSGMQTSRMLKLKMETSINMYDGIKLLLRKVESLYLDGGKDHVGEMLYDPITEGLPHLKHLTISNVSDIKVVINSMMLVSCLESLSLYNLINLEAICDHRQLRAESFGRLRVVKVRNCNMLKNLFSFSIVKGICGQLEELIVSYCENMRELVLVEKEEIVENEDILKFTQLRSLKLENLNKFIGLWSSEITLQSAACFFDQKVLFPAMEELTLSGISGIKKIWHDGQLTPIMSFGVQNLTSLIVKRCHKLKYVFTSSMVKSFVQLKRLEVSECDEMEEVIQGILGGEESTSSTIVRVFPKLDSVILHHLQKLKRFCCGINIPIEFPFLRTLRIKECYVLTTFLCNSTHIGGKRKDITLNHKFQTSNIFLPQHLFNEKVILPALEELEIGDMEKLERLWANQLAYQHSFSKLTSIRLEKCPKLLNVFPLSMLTRLQKLNYLRIENCESVEEILLESESELQEEGCSSSAIITVEFSCLTTLRLWKLPNLKSMHHKMLIINWPALKEMEVKECEKVEILFGCEETLISGKSSKEDRGLIRIQQPLFWVNQFTFPNLHKLTLGWNAGMKEIRHCNDHGQQQQQQLLYHYLSSLKVVELDDYPEEVTKLPSYLFHLLSLPTLQTLEVDECYFKEMMIFQSEEGGGEEKPASACLLLSQITELKLINLPELMHLWKEKEGFQSLRILEVIRCPKLGINLVPSSVSFKNLVIWKVSDCDGIIKLITHSTAKSLVQLEQMIIWGCVKMEEIVEGSGDDKGDDDEISFPKLNTLSLYNLPKLESFSSSENYTFGFQSLEEVVVDECPKMKMFSQRDSKTPILHKVISTWRKEERWEGNLNCTIQQLFTEQQNLLVEGVQNSIKDEASSSTSNTQ